MKKSIFKALRAPADLYYNGMPKLINVFGELSYAGDIEVTYRNRDTNEICIPIEVGNYRASASIGGIEIKEDYSIIENVGGEVAQTEFQKLQEKINAGGTIELRDRTIYAESTDKTLVIPEGITVKISMTQMDIDRSAAIEPGPVFDVRGTLILEGKTYVGRMRDQQIRGGTDSGIIVRAGGELIMEGYDWLAVTGNTSNRPGAGILCAGTLIQRGNFNVYGNKTKGEESGIHIANGGKIIYDYYYFKDGEDYAVEITTDNINQPIAISGNISNSQYTLITKRHVSGDRNYTTWFDKAAGKLYLIPDANYTFGTYADHYTTEESGVQTINRNDFSNDSTLGLMASSKNGSLGYIQIKEGSANKNVQLAFTTFSLSMVVPANTIYTIRHDFKLTMSRNSSGTLGYYGEMFYLGDKPNQNIAFTRGDTSAASTGSSGKAYYESKGGGSKTIPVNATYRNDSCEEQTITQWFGFYTGIGKASTYNHQTEFEMELVQLSSSPVSTSHLPDTHIYSAEWTKDSENHWKVCTVCGDMADLGVHVYDNERDNSCNICGYLRDIACREHIYDNDCDADCNICGEVRTITHTWQTEWSSDDTIHWHECSICHERNDEVAHSPEADDSDCTTAVHCSVCGAATTPAQSHDFTGDLMYDAEGHWHQCTHSGCAVVETKQNHVWIDGTPAPPPTYFTDGQRLDTCACGETRIVVLPKLDDRNSPTGDIRIGTISVRRLLNTITFGLFFKDTQKVTITSADAESGVKSTQYYLSTEILDTKAISSISSWIDYNDQILLNPNDKYVVYGRITDNHDNVLYLGSEGIIIDSTPPVIIGIDDGQTYCISAQFSVSEDNLNTVKVNGTAINPAGGKYTMTASGESNIVVADKAGNNTTLTVTINAAHTYDNDCDADCNVCGEVRTITHDWQTEWSSDEANHWHECSLCHVRNGEAAHIYDNAADKSCNICGYIREVDCTEHIYDNDCDADCNVCGEVRTITHSWQTEWSSDGINHWHECSVCHERTDESAHTPGADDNDCTTPVHCSVCGAETTPAQSHDFSGDLLHDTDGHWHECAYSSCTVTDTKQNHVWTEGTTNHPPTYLVDGQRIDTCTCGETKSVVLPKLVDSSAPTGTITIPTISGVTDGKIYCAAVTVTVTDDNLDTVKLDGRPITLADGKFTLSPADKVQIITAADKAGNSTTVMITVYDGHAWDEGIVTESPTASKKGVTTHTCTHCGETKTEEIAMLAPSITDGQNGSWKPDVGSTLTFKSDAAFSDFIDVLVDSKVIDAKYYEVKEGSIIVTLKADYLATLSAGTYTLAIQSTTGTAFAEFTVAAKVDEEDSSKPEDVKTPQTSDNSNMLLWIALLFVSGCILTEFVIKIKKRKQ